MHKWHDAIASGDTDTLDNLWDDSYISTGPDGQRITKREEMEIVADPEMHFHSLDVEDIQVKVFGRIAVVLGRSIARGQYKGEDVGGDYRFTTVFRNTDDGWRAIVSHGSRIAET